MKKVFLLLFILTGTALQLFAGDTSITVSANGRTLNAAILNALNLAVAQKYGMNVATSGSSAIFSEEAFISGTGGSVEKRISADQLNQQVKTVSSGRVTGFRILESRAENGGYAVTLQVFFPERYVVGNDPDNRRRMAVAVFRVNSANFSVFGKSNDANAWADALNRSLATKLTQSRKFTMLSRNFDAEINRELNRLQDPNASPADRIRMGQKLTSDYLVVGTITFDTVPPLQVNPYTNRAIVPQQALFATVNYQVLLAATGQLKWSDTIKIDALDFYESLLNGSMEESADYTATLICDGIISCILPYEVVGFAGDMVVIGEGKNSFTPGEYLTVYNLGDEVKDTRTGEVIDVIEMPVGMVQVIRSTEKLTYAKIVNGERKNIQVGARLRRDAAALRATDGDQPPAPAPQPVPTRVQGTESGGVVVPF